MRHVGAPAAAALGSSLLSPPPAAASLLTRRFRSRAGKDATEEFEEIGHSRAAKEMLGKYYIGEYAVSPTGWCRGV